MAITEKEALVSLRVLVHVAKADGTIAPDERAALEQALDALPGAHGDLAGFLEDATPLDDLLGEVKSEEAREQLVQAAVGLIHADGVASPEERKLVEHVRVRLDVSAEKASLAQRIVGEAKDTLLPSAIEPVTDPTRRAKEIQEDVLKYSMLSAVLGAFPVPGVAIATDLAVVALQVKLVRDVGQYWGHKVDRTAAKSLLAGVGLGTGARIAVANLAKLVPVWGSAFGAASAFATTWAIGRLADRYFANDGKVDMSLLRKEMKDAEREGKEAYAKNQDAIEAKKKAHETQLAGLSEELKAGKITQDEYERRVAALA